MICAKSIGDWTPGKRICFTHITGFSEQVTEDLIDDNLTDSVMGLYKMEDGRYCLNTEKRELMIHTLSKPNIETA